MPPEDEKPTTPPAPANDELKNFKAESARKMDNINAQLAQLLATVTPKAPAAPEGKKVSVFEDEEGFRASLKAEAKAEALAEQQKLHAAQQKQQNVLAQLVSEFPELGDANSELTKKAVEIYNSYPEEDRQNTLAYRAAAKEAALEIGIKPKHKRSQDEVEQFQLGSRGGPSIKPPKRGELTDGVQLAAQLLGLDISKPEVKKSLAKRAERESWNRWATPAKKGE